MKVESTVNTKKADDDDFFFRSGLRSSSTSVSLTVGLGYYLDGLGGQAERKLGEKESQIERGRAHPSGGMGPSFRPNQIIESRDARGVHCQHDGLTCGRWKLCLEAELVFPPRSRTQPSHGQTS